jgi:large conductance mechanosensitive channel
LNFLIIARVLFLAIEGTMKLKKEEPAAPAPGPTAEAKMLIEIRDLLKKRTPGSHNPSLVW